MNISINPHKGKKQINWKYKYYSQKQTNINYPFEMFSFNRITGNGTKNWVT